MTELEQRVDQEVGNLTELSRTSFLKFVNLGRELERESLGQADKIYSKDDLTAKMAELLLRVKTAVDTAEIQLAEVEETNEDDVFDVIKAQAEVGPVRAALISQFESLLKTCDEKNKEIQSGLQKELGAIRSEFLGE